MNMDPKFSRNALLNGLLLMINWISFANTMPSKDVSMYHLPVHTIHFAKHTMIKLRA